MKRRGAQGLVGWAIAAAVGLSLAAGAYAAYLLLRPAVTVTEVVEGPVVEAFYATGTLQPAHEYPLKSNTAGLLRPPPGGAYVDKGAHVTRGQPLALVEDPQLIHLVAKTRAEAEERRKRAEEKTSPVLLEFDAKLSATAEILEIAKRELVRVTRLLETSAGTQADLDRSLDRVKTLWADLESLKAEKQAMRFQLARELEVAESALKIAESDLDLQTLRSPIDGVVLDRPVSLGTRLAVNDHVMQIADVRPENLVMRAQVDEEDVTGVRVDETSPQAVRMTLYAFPGRSFEGKATRVYDKADPDRRTFEVDVALAAPDPKMAAGMTAELAFIRAERPRAMVVPSQAVQGDGTVYVVRQGRLRQPAVRIGLKSVERAEVISGLAPGDRVVISPVGKLTEGQAVRIGAVVDAATAAGLNKPQQAEVMKAFH